MWNYSKVLLVPHHFLTFPRFCQKSEINKQKKKKKKIIFSQGLDRNSPFVRIGLAPLELEIFRFEITRSKAIPAAISVGNKCIYLFF